MTLRLTLAALSYLCASGVAFAQLASGPVPSATNLAAGQGPFLGSIPAGQATGTPLALSLEDAISRGLRSNLGAFLGQQGIRSAESARLNARSALLPNFSASVSNVVQQINLKAFGFPSFPGVAPIVGPFNVFDARASVSQAILSLSALHRSRAGNENLRAAQYSYQDARDIVVLGVAGLYLQAIAGRARIDTAQAQFKTAQALYQRAVDMKQAGVVPQIDVLRAQVEMQAQQQRVIFYQNEFEKQKLELARAVGLPVGQSITLSDQAPYTPPPPLTVEGALDQALQNRADYKSAAASVSAAESARRAAVAERYPGLQFDANYGAIGPRPWDSHGTVVAGATLTIPIYRAGRTGADILQADAALDQRKAELADLRNEVEQQIRSALLDLKASGDQVAVSESAVKLAGEQLKQAEDRFSAGVADNIEVIQAQEAVATADENNISALFAYNLAKASLARAVGGAEKMYLEFLRGAH